MCTMCFSLPVVFLILRYNIVDTYGSIDNILFVCVSLIVLKWNDT